MGVIVKKSGVCTTVQDRGRIGYLSSGFSPNGVMDRRAHALANLLVENDLNAPVLEFALAGPSLRFTTNSVIAITGGDFQPMLDDRPLPQYAAVSVKQGQTLNFGALRAGMYGYLAIAGGSIKMEPTMGSCSTDLKCGIGGWRGRALILGDYLPFRAHDVDCLPNQRSHCMEPDDVYGFGESEVILRTVLGPQDRLFTERGLTTFFSEPFTTTIKSDRMGCRLDGPLVETKHGSDIVSDGIAFGAIQIPSHGRPIIMLADRQTTGGYAKIGTVASVDIPRLVQAKPGTTVRFVPISLDEAQRLLREEHAWFQRLAKKFRRPSGGDVSPRRTARRLTPILEEQARRSRSNSLWIDFANLSQRAGNRNELENLLNSDGFARGSGFHPAAEPLDPHRCER